MFSGRWFPLQRPLSIAYKELFHVVLAVRVWGPRWPRRRILFHADNEAVIHILNSRTSKDPNIMHLLHSLLKVAACLSFTFAAVHEFFWLSLLFQKCSMTHFSRHIVYDRCHPENCQSLTSAFLND